MDNSKNFELLSPNPLSTTHHVVSELITLSRAAGLSGEPWDSILSPESPPTFQDILAVESFADAYSSGTTFPVQPDSKEVHPLIIGLSQDGIAAINRWGSTQVMALPQGLAASTLGPAERNTKVIQTAHFYKGIRDILPNIESNPGGYQQARELLALLYLTVQSNHNISTKLQGAKKARLSTVSSSEMHIKLWNSVLHALGIYTTLNDSLYTAVGEVGGFPEDGVIHLGKETLGLFFTVNMLKQLEYLSFGKSKDTGILSRRPSSQHQADVRVGIFKAVAGLLNPAEGGYVDFFATKEILKKNVGNYPGLLSVDIWSAIDLSLLDPEFLDYMPQYTGFSLATAGPIKADANFSNFISVVKNLLGNNKRPIFELASGGYVEIPKIRGLIADREHGGYNQKIHIGYTSAYNKRGSMAPLVTFIPGTNVEITAYLPDYSSRARIDAEVEFIETEMLLSIEKLAALLIDGVAIRKIKGAV